MAELLRSNSAIESIQLGDNSRLVSADLSADTVRLLKTFEGRVALDSRPLGQSGFLRRYHTSGDAGSGVTNSIMNIIKNKIGSQSKPQITVSSRPEDKGRLESLRKEFGLHGGKENRSLMANLPVRVNATKEDKNTSRHLPSSDSLLTVPNKQYSTEKPRNASGRPESQQLMMSRIGWLFELRNLYDKLKRKSNHGAVSKEHFLGQFKRVVGVIAQLGSS